MICRCTREIHLLSTKLDSSGSKVLLERDLGLPTRLVARSRRDFAVVGAGVNEKRIKLEGIVFERRQQRRENLERSVREVSLGLLVHTKAKKRGRTWNSIFRSARHNSQGGTCSGPILRLLAHRGCGSSTPGIR